MYNKPRPTKNPRFISNLSNEVKDSKKIIKKQYVGGAYV